MDGIALLQEARAARLRVEARGAELVVHGPPRAEALALRLLAHKAEILEALAKETASTPRCGQCGRVKFQIRDRRPRCLICDGAFLPLGDGGEAQ